MTNQFWSPIVQRLKPYQAGEQPDFADMVKLNTNEHPYGPSPKVLEALHAAIGDQLRLYPDPDSSRLRAALSNYFSLPSDHFFIGNGSDEVLAHVFNGLLNHPQPLLFPDITYSFYKTYTSLYGIDYKTIPLNSAFQINLSDYQQSSGAIIFANPNAPTGVYLPLDHLSGYLDDHPDVLVVVDEAYIDFGGQSAIALVHKYPNLLVVHTFSKSRALAGLRVGYAVGQPHLIRALERIKNSFNSYPLDRLAQVAAEAALLDQTWFSNVTAKIIADRDALARSMSQLGFDVLPSAANFIFVRHQNANAARIAESLRQQHVFVRHFNQERVLEWLRITVGQPAQHQRLLQVLQTFL